MAPYLLLILLAAQPLASQQVPAEPGRWVFDPPPDDFRPGAALDLRYLNETVAGESGFVWVDQNGDFLLANGKPVRFWAVNTNVGREQPFVVKPRGRKTEPDLARHARFLAKRGVNMVRLHAHINPDIRANPNAPITAIDEKERDWIWRTVAAMKKEGIYVTVSPYWPNTMAFNPRWDYPGDPTMPAHALLFFDEPMQEAYKQWMFQLLVPPNPYTGIPLTEDPALAIIQLQNEDSLLFYTVDRLRGAPRTRLMRKFGAWAAAKYGSAAAAVRAWDNRTLRGDDPDAEMLDFYILWEMTQNRTGGAARRLADQLQFWTELMHGFHAGMARYLKHELGCGQLVNATNWKSGDPVRLEDAERYSYTSTDVLAKNRYYAGVHNGPNRGWAIMNNDEFTSPSILRNPRDFPLNLRQVRGYPFLITESAWVNPMAYQSEGPFLIAAYQSLTGVDAYYWFATGDDEWTPPQSANGYLASQQKWMFGNPDMLGGFPAAALLYRMGYVKRGEPVLVEQRALEDLWQRRTPLLAESPSFDPNRDAGDIAPASSVKTGVDPAAFFVGPVEVIFHGDPSATRAADLKPYVADNGKTIRGNTGELVLNTDAGYCTLNAPKAQGVAAFFDRQPTFQLRDIGIRSGNHYGAVLAVPLDDRPLGESRRVLLQVVTQSRPTGWVEQPLEITTQERLTFDGFKVVDYGRAPWQVVRADVTIALRNTGLTKAAALDPNGYPKQALAVTRTAAGIEIRFPEDALYVVAE